MHSESKLFEEEINGGLLLIGGVGGVVSLGEDLLDLVLELLPGLLVGQLVFSNNSLELLSGLSELSSDLETGRQDVVVVHDFGEWLQGASSLDLGLAHSLGHSQRGSLDSGHKGVGEGLALLSLIELFDNNGLLSGSSSGEQDDDSAWFHAKPNKQWRATYIFFMLLLSIK